MVKKEEEEMKEITEATWKDITSEEILTISKRLTLTDSKVKISTVKTQKAFYANLRRIDSERETISDPPTMEYISGFWGSLWSNKWLYIVNAKIVRRWE